jgi:hypothetical protein
MSLIYTENGIIAKFFTKSSIRFYTALTQNSRSCARYAAFASRREFMCYRKATP